MNVMEIGKNVGQYVGVSFDKRRKFKDNGTFRIIIYGAYNAMGLIGSELNGVAILDEGNHSVVADELAKQQSGYFGASAEQVSLAKKIMKMNWADFRMFVNSSGRNRYNI